MPLSHFVRPFRIYWLAVILLLMPVSTISAQDATATPDPNTPPVVPERVDVQPVARDSQIETRLQDILDATGWFIDSSVDVQDGVVFLMGDTQSEEFKSWATNLAQNTQDVAAVVNQITVLEPALLDFQPITTSLQRLTIDVMRSIPLMVFSLIILFAAWLFARFLTRTANQYLKRRDLNILLRNVISRTIGIIVFILGLYVVFQVAGWTSIALTILGGTGLLGLILGIAFRDISENFLASIFLSVQNPFSVGDLVEINEVQGFVQTMTTRTTILMTLAGNHVQIPNATVYKSVIHNYTSNPNIRIDFIIGIGYDDSISLAQETIRKVLEEHPATLNDPEPLVLVSSLGSATVNLEVFFWINGTEHSVLKTKSSVIRLVKSAIQDAGVSMPDEAREMIFPQGVPVQILGDGTTDTIAPQKPPITKPPQEDDTVSTTAEGDLSSEAEEINNQAQRSRKPEEGENLLKSD